MQQDVKAGIMAFHLISRSNVIKTSAHLCNEGVSLAQWGSHPQVRPGGKQQPACESVTNKPVQTTV